MVERGLAIRGHDEIIGYAHNANYLGTLELMAKFDPFLATHVYKCGAKSRRSVSLLSSTICSKLIDVVSKKVLNHIITEVKQSKYFSVSVDSTPGISRIDRLTCIFRYVLDDTPIERLVKFLDTKRQTAKISEIFLSFYQNPTFPLETVGVNNMTMLAIFRSDTRDYKQSFVRKNLLLSGFRVLVIH